MPVNQLIANPAGLDLPRAWGSAMKLAEMKSQYDYEPRERQFGEALTLAQIGRYQQQKTQGTNDQQHKEAEGLARGVMSVPPAMRQQAYKAMKQEAMNLGHANASQLPDQLTPEVEARLDMLARSGGTAEQYASQQAEARNYPAEPGAPAAAPANAGGPVAAPPGVPLNQIQPEDGQAYQPVPPNLSADQENAAWEKQQLTVPPVEPNAKRPDETPDSIRAEARAIRAKGGKANYERYKDELARAEKLDDRIFKERDQNKLTPEADIGGTFNPKTGGYEADGKPLSAAEVVAKRLAAKRAGATNVNVGMNAGDAAKAELLNQGISDMAEFKGMIIGPDGKIDRGIVTAMNVPGVAGVPGTDSRMAYSLLRNAIEAKLRAETGAAAPDAEVQRLLDRFSPSPLDNDETIRSKIRRMEAFLRGSFGRIKGAGEPSVKPGPRRREADKNPPKTIKWDDLK